jgi:hypothetical protein
MFIRRITSDQLISQGIVKIEPLRSTRSYISNFVTSNEKQKIFSERECYLKNECAKCPHLVGVYNDGNLPLLNDTYIVNRETGNELLISEKTKNIKVTRFPITVCEPPPQSFQYMKELEDVI